MEPEINLTPQFNMLNNNNNKYLWIYKKCFILYHGDREKNKQRKKDSKMKLTEKQILNILKNKLINKCTKEEKKQVFNFAFGEEYMESNDKGKLKNYNGIKSRCGS